MDYCHVNAVTRKDVFPLPCIERLTTWEENLDAKISYRQIQVVKKRRLSPWKAYTSSRHLACVYNASETSQQRMQRILRGLEDSCSLCINAVIASWWTESRKIGSRIVSDLMESMITADKTCFNLQHLLWKASAKESFRIFSGHYSVQGLCEKQAKGMGGKECTWLTVRVTYTFYRGAGHCIWPH